MDATAYARQFPARRGWPVGEIEEFESGGQHVERFCTALLVAPPKARDAGA